MAGDALLRLDVLMDLDRLSWVDVLRAHEPARLVCTSWPMALGISAGTAQGGKLLTQSSTAWEWEACCEPIEVQGEEALTRGGKHGSHVNSSRPFLSPHTAQPPNHAVLTCANGDGSQVKGPQPLPNLFKHRRHAGVPTKPKAPAGAGVDGVAR